MYLDAQCNVVHVDCLKSAEEEEPNSQQLSVSDVEMLPLESVSKLLMQNRWQLCKVLLSAVVAWRRVHACTHVSDGASCAPYAAVRYRRHPETFRQGPLYAG